LVPIFKCETKVVTLTRLSYAVYADLCGWSLCH
jgi:hypothetical protein